MLSKLSSRAPACVLRQRWSSLPRARLDPSLSWPSQDLKRSQIDSRLIFNSRQWKELRWSSSVTAAPSAAPSVASTTVPSPDPIASVVSSLDGIAPVSAMGPDNFVSNLLSTVHLATGMPWWLELSIAAFLVRMVLLPFLIAQVKNAAILEMLAPHIQRLTMQIDSARKQNRHAEALFVTEGLNTLYRGHNVSILRNFQLALLNIPLLFIFSNGIRVLVSYPQTLQEGGAAWLTDLTIADPYHVVPAVLVILHLSNIFLNRRIYKTKFSKWMMWLGVAFSIPLGALGWFAPAAYACYWIPSALFSLLMNALFLTRGFRRLCGIPTAPLDMDREDLEWREIKRRREAENSLRKSESKAP